MLVGQAKRNGVVLLSSVLLWLGVVLMLSAWLWLGRHVIDRSATQYTMVATTGFWLTPLLLSVPVFSRDTYSYLAQGALLRDGFDPYLVGPIENPNSLLDNVSPIWTTTTAPSRLMPRASKMSSPCLG